MPAVEQCFEDRVRAAHGEDIGRQIAPARLQIREQRRAGRHFSDIIEREAQSGLIRNGGQMQPGIGRAAGCRHDRGCILQGFSGDEVARQRPAAREHFGDALTRTPRQREALGIDRRQHRRTRRGEAQRLRYHRHRIRGELAGAGAHRGRACPLQTHELGLAHLAPDR